MFLFLALGWSGAISAQTVVGTWQGTLPNAQQQRIVLKIVKAEDGSLRSSVYRLGTGGGGVPMSSTTFTPPALDADLNSGQVHYKGTLIADGKSMEGTWNYGKEISPLTLTLAAADALWTLDYAGQPAMAANADPSFEVATIKPSPPDQTMKRYGIRTRNFKAVGESVSEMICWAYHLNARQIEGAPAWMNTQYFDIAGKPDLPGQPSEEQYRLMLRKLLAERFNLKTHMTKKEMPVYALVVDRNPPPLANSVLGLDDMQPRLYINTASDGRLLAVASYLSMQDFVDWIMNAIRDRQIVDETGLKGRFDFKLTLPAELMGGKYDEDEEANAFIGAVHQIGMKLVPKKERIDVLVIDSVDRPSAN